MSILHLDLETFSRCDLKAEGLARYAEDPSTGVHCAAYAFDDEPVGIWTEGQPCPGQITAHVEAGGTVYAHNAAFEIALTNEVLAKKHGWPVLKPEQCRCTMAMAYAMALPGSLEQAAPALGLSVRKDALGKRIMLQLCKTKPDGTMWRPQDDPAKFDKLYDYCKTDVEVERALHHWLMELSPSEQELWTLDYKINQRGILVDTGAIGKALLLVESEKKRLDRKMLLATGGVVRSCSSIADLTLWVGSQGVEIGGVAKAEVTDLLDGELPDNVRVALELRQEAAKSSTAKLKAMKDRVNSDGRIRGCHQYHGASTGRWAGRGVQVQNLPRTRPGIKPQDVEQIIANLGNRGYVDALYGPVLDALADSLRGMIIASPGKDLVAVDFSSIEARVLAWLAGEESVLEAFRRKEDIYKVAASAIYHVPQDQVTQDQRQIGKVSILACGYGGGVGAFQSMAKVYGVKVPDAEAEQIKKAWRAANPRIVSFWDGLEDAAIQALKSKGAVSYSVLPTVGRECAFKKAGSFLWCKLPSGRVLCYPYPEIRTVTTPWGEEKEALTYMTVVSNIKAKILPDENAAGSWKRISTFGGSMCENITQAVARDLLAEAMKRLDKCGFDITMHVHDEAVIEIPDDAGPGMLKRIEDMFSVNPAWATGLPIAAEGWRGPRYRK